MFEFRGSAVPSSVFRRSIHFCFTRERLCRVLLKVVSGSRIAVIYNCSLFTETRQNAKPEIFLQSHSPKPLCCSGERGLVQFKENLSAMRARPSHAEGKETVNNPSECTHSNHRHPAADQLETLNPQPLTWLLSLLFVYSKVTLSCHSEKGRNLSGVAMYPCLL